MALYAAPRASALHGKRKLANDASGNSSLIKKLRSDNPSASSPATLDPSEPVGDCFLNLGPKYEVKNLSVLSSTSIAKRVDNILEHLSRFHPWDQTILPGVVHLYSRASTANKLITIAELVRRRIHESDQKWYQYNRTLHELEWAAKYVDAAQSHDNSAVEDSLMGTNDNPEGVEADDDDYFESMHNGPSAAPPTQFERAVHEQPKPRMLVRMSITLSRVPVPELRAMDNFSEQSNEEYIDYIRKKRAGLV